MPEAIHFLHDVASQHAVGGKARGLAKLTAAGFSVPDITVPFRVYGAYGVAVALLAIAITATAFQRGDSWAW